MFTVLLDNGHGSNTPGKRSPDGRFREYQYTRKVVKELDKRLKENGVESIIIVPETWDVSLSSRVSRINNYIRQRGAKNCLMISVHNNAAGMGNWMSARGWSAWTTRGQNNSDKLADCLYEAAERIFPSVSSIKEDYAKETKYKITMTQKTDGDKDCEADFYIIKGANCPAVLTENFFQDNKKDVALLESDDGFNAIVEVHLQGILNFIKKKQNNQI